MADFIKANTMAPGEDLPQPYVVVDAIDDKGLNCKAMVVGCDSWAYAEPERYGVAACVEYWKPKDS